jgi:hypothetical protein
MDQADVSLGFIPAQASANLPGREAQKLSGFHLGELTLELPSIGV